MNARRQSPAAGRASGGFTLLELLLAFVVFALSFATVLEILSGSMRNTVRARQDTEAALVAQSVMDQLGLEIPYEDGFRADGEDGDYQWTIEVYAYEGEDGDGSAIELGEMVGIELLQIDLDVAWGKPPRDRVSQFSTLRAVMIDREPAL
ncbi:MAG: prepilin-type N-terminal cleavage/methylation domain-containing protein [Xanthomonadales bacterium]|nr:prepilin-type N-terminal cleavage/methylation domain-containing protein [Xanthomonadales bacterium]